MPKAKAMSVDDKKYQAESDARTLTDHATITSDPERHQAATDHLQKKHDDSKMALHHAKKQLSKKVKGGLDKAFPKDKKAGESAPASDMA